MSIQDLLITTGRSAMSVHHGPFAFLSAFWGDGFNFPNL
jgi:hypothetical protein